MEKEEIEEIEEFEIGDKRIPKKLNKRKTENKIIFNIMIDTGLVNEILNSSNIEKTKDIGFYIYSNQGDLLKSLSETVLLGLNEIGEYSKSINIRNLEIKQLIHKTNVINKQINSVIIFDILIIQLILSDKDIECIAQTNYPDLAYIGTEEDPFISMDDKKLYSWNFIK